MSKSLAQKKSDKKRKGERKAKLRAPKEYSRGRQAQAAHPVRERNVGRMLVRNAALTVVRVVATDWHRDPDNSELELNRFTLNLSDGSVVEKQCEVQYAPGDREEILVGSTSAVPERRAKALVALLRARNARVETVAAMYRWLQQTYGSLPATEHEPVNYPVRAA